MKLEEEIVHVVTDDMTDDDQQFNGSSSSLSFGELKDDEDSFYSDDYNDDDAEKGDPNKGGDNGSSRKKSDPNDESLVMMTPEYKFGNRLMICTRLCLWLMMLSAAAALGYFTYDYLSDSQQDEMIEDYEEVTAALQQYSQSKFNYIIQSLAIASNVASTLQQQKQPQQQAAAQAAFSPNEEGNIFDDERSYDDWPFVTLPNFESWVGNFDDLNITMSVLVTESQRNDWNTYSDTNAKAWIEESYDYVTQEDRRQSSDIDISRLTPYIWHHPEGVDENSGYIGKRTEVNEGDGSGISEATLISSSVMYAASWQSTYPVSVEDINHNDLDNDLFQHVFDLLMDDGTKSTAASAVVSKLFACDSESQEICMWFLQPIVSTKLGRQEMVAYMKSKIPIGYLFQRPQQDTSEGQAGIYAIFESTSSACLAETFSMEIDSKGNIVYVDVAEDDLHDVAYDEYVVQYRFQETSGCGYHVRLYPIHNLISSYNNEETTNSVYIFTGIVVGIVVLIMTMFCIYDCSVRYHQRNLIKSAGKSKAIVDSLFPENVRDRLMESEHKSKKSRNKNNGKTNVGGIEKSVGSITSPWLNLTNRSSHSKSRGTTVASGGNNTSSKLDGKPIADFFPHCTVLFADIVGFTAWSSVRDPTQVFTLLETLYNCFDTIAQKKKVFKVETIGDCYVAVTGLPVPMDDHALAMAKFAKQCMVRMFRIVRDLEIELGPDTGDLSMRFGLHSGPVTAGVMRGEKSRFQLFGDTVNTAARIESTGERAKIHLSEDTADLIIAAGKGHWVTARKGKVSAKGKGQLQTYWLDLSAGKNSMDSGSVDIGLVGDGQEDFKPGESFGSIGVGNLVAQFENRHKLNSLDERTKRQADYIVEVLISILKKIAARRGLSTVSHASKSDTTASSEEFNILEEHGTNLSPVAKDSISFQSQYRNKNGTSLNQISVAPGITKQVKDFVTSIAALHQENPYHSFEHANHIMMSARKLFSRVVTEENAGNRMDINTRIKAKATSHKLEDINFAITDDPITEFALVFAALIHHVEHPGIPNSQLVSEKGSLAKKFEGKSVTEKNAIQVAWTLLMKPAYRDFRRSIYSTKGELDRFRGLVVNLVLAADIHDKDASASRSLRWERAFTLSKKSSSSRGKTVKGSNQQQQDMKATIVLEHLFQAAAIAHTMQHWNVYTKWNRQEFREASEAYKDGRGKKDPARYWFQGEVTFFDTFVIPLSNRLKECGVFGDACEEYSSYAKANRRDWKTKGREVVLDYMEELRNGGKRISPSSGHSNATYSTLSASSHHNSFTFIPPSSNGSLSKSPRPRKPRSSSSSNLMTTPTAAPRRFKLKSPVYEQADGVKN